MKPIMIVTNDKDTLDGIACLTPKREGFEAFGAPIGKKAAVQFLLERKPGLIIMDAFVQWLDKKVNWFEGKKETFKALREADPTVKIYFFGLDEDIELFKEAKIGADGYWDPLRDIPEIQKILEDYRTGCL